jgi:N-acetylneuraminic acid mutarotase
MNKTNVIRHLLYLVLGVACFGLGLSSVVQATNPPSVLWRPAHPMNKARAFFTAVELLNANVLVAGGYDGSLPGPPNFADAEIYDSRTGLWTSISPMNSARSAPVGLLLDDGRVMVIGGFDENFNVLGSAEIYDPSTGTWTLTASMNDARVEDFVAVQLSGGRVLVAGGTGSDGVTSLSSAEIYDEAANTWTPTESMNVARQEFASEVLQDGRVLAVGGVATDGTPIASAEIYDPATGIWTLTGSMGTARNDLSVTVLQDGRVLAAGGGMGSEELPRYSTAEIYAPATGIWSPTGDMTIAHSETEYAAPLLPDGRVLVTGGHAAPHTPVSNADLYDPTTGTWSQAGFMSEPRAGHSAILTNRGVLVMGGLTSGPAATASADIAIELPRRHSTPAPRP